MATVRLTFAAVPAQVRTARLVAVAMARHAGVAEAELDDVRLAVGQAAVRAVQLHQVHCPGAAITVLLEDTDGLVVTVLDRVPDAAASGMEPFPGALSTSDLPSAVASSAIVAGALAAPGVTPEAVTVSAAVGLAVITELVEQVEVSDTPEGGSVRMRWPAPSAPGAGRRDPRHAPTR